MNSKIFFLACFLFLGGWRCLIWTNAFFLGRYAFFGGHLRLESCCIWVNMVLGVSPGNWRLGRYFKEWRQDGVGIGLVRVYDSAIAFCAKAFITHIRVTVAAPNFLGGNVFGTGIFQWHLIPWNRTSLIPFACHFLCLLPLSYPSSFKIHELNGSGGGSISGGGGVIIRYVLAVTDMQTQILYPCKVTCFQLACKHVLYQCTIFPETLVMFYGRSCTIPVLLSNTRSFKKPHKVNPVE
jgi:hypothetical protein